MAQTSRPLAVVTGASTGIGYELAKCCAEDGFDLVVAADEPEIKDRGQGFRSAGRQGRCFAGRPRRRSKASTSSMQPSAARPVDALLANAGRGLGKGFLDQDFDEVLQVINTNITGTIYLIQKVGRDMRARGAGRILITGSIAGFMPGTYQAVYNATKAFLDSFSFALRAELKDTGVTVTCLMPGRDGNRVLRPRRHARHQGRTGQEGRSRRRRQTGFKAMMKGEGDVVTGWQNKLQSAIANVTPASMLAEQHRKKAEPGSASTKP